MRNTHDLNYINLCAGAYQIQTFDYYGNTGPVVEGIVAEPAQVQVDLGPDFVLRCGEDTVIAGDAWWKYFKRYYFGFKIH